MKLTYALLFLNLILVTQVTANSLLQMRPSETTPSSQTKSEDVYSKYMDPGRITVDSNNNWTEPQPETYAKNLKLAEHLNTIATTLIELNLEHVITTNTPRDLANLNLATLYSLFSKEEGFRLGSLDRLNVFLDKMREADKELNSFQILGALNLFLIKEWLTTFLVLNQEYLSQESLKNQLTQSQRLARDIIFFFTSVRQHIRDAVIIETQNIFSSSTGTMKAFTESLGLNFQELRALEQHLRDLSQHNPETFNRALQQLLQFQFSKMNIDLRKANMEAKPIFPPAIENVEYANRFTTTILGGIFLSPFAASVIGMATTFSTQQAYGAGFIFSLVASGILTFTTPKVSSFTKNIFRQISNSLKLHVEEREQERRQQEAKQKVRLLTNAYLSTIFIDLNCKSYFNR